MAKLFWPDRKRYLGDDKPGWAWTPRIDHGPSKDFIVHQIATAANLLGLENVPTWKSCRRPAPG